MEQFVGNENAADALERARGSLSILPGLPGIGLVGTCGRAGS